MRYRATPDFWYCYRQLPAEIQELADRCYEFLKQDSRHPSLHFKKVGSFWSVRVGIHYRALAVEDNGDIAWFWIGTHAEYDRLLRGGYVELWRHNIFALAKQHRVYAFDMVGAGRSDKPDNVEYTFDYMARFTRDFMQALAIPRASLIGASAGGAVALNVMLQFPETVAKSILVGSAGLGKEVSWLLKLPTLPIVGELLGSPSRSSLKMLCQQAVYNPQIMTDEIIEEFYQMAMLPGATASLLNLGRANFNLWGQLARLGDRLVTILTPTLIIWGRQDPIVPLAQGQNAARVMPNARLEIIEECGHWSPIEHPATFNRLGLEFLN